MKKTLYTFVLLLVLLNTNAQESLPITLDKVLEIAGADNLTIKICQEQINLSKAELSQAKSWWLPNIYGGAETHQLSGAVMNSNGKFYLDVERENLWLGLGLDLNWDLSSGILDTKASRLRNQANHYRSEAEKNQTLLSVIYAYYDLLESQLNLEAYEKLILQSESIVNQIEIQVEAGLRYQSEVLLAKSNKNHLELASLKAKNEFNKTSTILRSLLNIEQDVLLVTVEKQLVVLEGIANVVIKNHDRAEVKEQTLDIKALKVQKKKYTIGLLFPDINLTAQRSLFGKINGNVVPVDPINYPNTDQLYPTNIINGSLKWKIPLGAFIYKGDIKKQSSLIRLKELEKEETIVTINREIKMAIEDIRSGEKAIKISKEGLEFSSEALNQSIERQKLGTAKPFEVIQTQEFFLQSEIDYIKAVGTYNKAQFAYKVAIGEKL